MMGWAGAGAVLSDRERQRQAGLKDAGAENPEGLQPADKDQPPLLFFHFLDKRCGVNDLDALVMFKVSKVGISGNDIMRFSFKGADKEHVVSRINLDLINLVKPFCYQRPIQDHAYEIINIAF
jgi:hypothetical protein